VTQWIFDLFDTLGAAGVGLLIFLDNFFPPIPSELVLPLAGFRARVGDVDPVWVWPLATIGSVAGAVGVYWLGAWLGYDRLHALAAKRWFIVFSQKDLERGRRLFEAHGGKMVLLGRCVPFVRSVISVPAGVVAMPMGLFLLLTTIGSGVWNAIWIGLGYALGEHWEVLERFGDTASTVVMVAVILALVWLVVRKVRANEKAPGGEDAPTEVMPPVTGVDDETRPIPLTPPGGTPSPPR
jgi:membrane protein DedA with SNARE-associated domain